MKISPYGMKASIEAAKMVSLEDEEKSKAVKEKIIRTVINEVIVNHEEDSDTLKFIIHWKGGCHTEFEMPKPPSGIGQKTQEEDLEIIRKMATRLQVLKSSQL